MDSPSNSSKLDVDGAPLFKMTIWVIFYNYILFLLPFITIGFYAYFYWKIWKHKIQVSTQMKIHAITWIWCVGCTELSFGYFVVELRWMSKCFWGCLKNLHKFKGKINLLDFFILKY